MKYFLILCMIALAVAASAKPPCAGCINQLEGDDLKKSEAVLNKSLKKLATGEGPSYTLVKINSASTQVVAGSLDRINADLEDKDKNIKTCDIEIWSQPWLENGISVTFDCPGEEKLVRKHSA